VCVDCNRLSPGTESQGHTGQPSRVGVDVRISKDSNDTILHEMLYFNVRSKADMSQLNLPHRTNRKVENRKTKKQKTDMLRSIGKQSMESVVKSNVVGLPSIID